MIKTTRRKANTALVYNPSRGLLSMGGGRSTVRRASARKNPTARRPTAVTNPRHKRRRVHHRRRSNPASTSGLLVSAFMAAVGVSVFDLAASRLLPQTSAVVRIGVKLGAAFLCQSMGERLPLIGKYNKEIALVLGVAGFVDAIKLWVLPLASTTLSNFTGGALQLVPAPVAAGAAAGDGTTGNLYGAAPWSQQYA